MNTNTKYLGLDVSSPIVVGSSGLTNSVDNLLQMESAGAGAVVLKSIYEEQIIFDIKRSMNVVAPTSLYGKSYEYVAAHSSGDKLSRYFDFVADAKSKLQIPVIGSIDCYSFENWITYASRFQQAGCDGLELNIAVLPYETSTSAEDVDRLFNNVIQTLKKSVTIPISIKVSPYFTDMAKYMQQLSWTGVNSITLFNKPLNIDINIETQEIEHATTISHPDDLYNTLRWVAVLSKKLRCEVSASTGVHTAADVVKMLLAGAQTIQLSSVLYKNGIAYIKDIKDGLCQWMEAKGYNSIDDFRGKLAYAATGDAFMHLRTLCMEHLAEM